jgi:hypothetical protein
MQIVFHWILTKRRFVQDERHVKMKVNAFWIVQLAQLQQYVFDLSVSMAEGVNSQRRLLVSHLMLFLDIIFDRM